MLIIGANDTIKCEKYTNTKIKNKLMTMFKNALNNEYNSMRNINKGASFSCEVEYFFGLVVWGGVGEEVEGDVGA